VDDEIGEAIGRIGNDAASPESRFDGYTDRAASDRKVLRDVFVHGDAWFRSGDLMRRDSAGFFYFIDRAGDTFRWHGENVSTTEVENAVSSWPQVRQAAVYGVQVPGTDGRAGMIAIVSDEGLDLDGLSGHLATRLPDYARPVFVRLLREIETTGTFKPRKEDLVRMGFDPRATTDPLFVRDRSTGSYVRLDDTMFERIRAGQFRI
jgi:fatty-acyl-CoA synthase